MHWSRLPLGLRLAIVIPCWVAVVWVGVPWGVGLLGRRWGVPELLPPPWPLLGLIPFAAGAAAAVTCVWFFYRWGRGTPVPLDPPAALVTTGPYAWCRNPMLAAQGVMWAGETILLRAWLLGALLAAGLVVAHLLLKYMEEPRLVARFGEAYEEYRRRVPMWVPRLRRGGGAAVTPPGGPGT